VYVDPTATKVTEDSWKFAKGASKGRKMLISQNSKVQTAAWVIPSTAVFHKGKKVWCRNNCIFK